MNCKHCDKPISRVKFRRQDYTQWRHTSSGRVYCVSYTKAEPIKEDTDG